MANVPLVQTQLVPPRWTDCLRRARLRKEGRAILSHRVTCVVAPAGYGKSVWVSSLLEEPGWPRTAWLSLDRHDAEPSYLLFHLIHAVRRAVPRFGAGCLRTMNSLEDVRRQWRVVAATLIEELPREGELILVLDDFHLVNEGEIVRHILEYLLRWLPAGVHLVLIARNQPALNLHRERLAGELLEVGSVDLLFSPGEAWELLALFGLELSEEAARLVYSHTEGWAVGLRLMAIFLRQTGGEVERTLAAWEGKDDDFFYTYLANTLLDNLPAGLRDFLLDISLLPYIDTGLGNAALQRGDSGALIGDLYSFGLLSRIGGVQETYRLHHLVAEFLARRARQARSPAYVVALRQRAAAFLEQAGDIDRALEQFVAGADWPGAAGLIARHGDRYFLTGGRLDALETWLGRLPPEQVEGDHRLLYFQGMSRVHLQPDQALDTLSRAVDRAGEKGDVKCQLRSLLGMIAVHTFANDVQKIRETAARIPVAAALLKSSWSRGMVLVAGLSRAAWEGNLRQGVWMSRLAARTPLEDESRMACWMFSSIVWYRLGNLDYARELIERVLRDPYVQENERWTGTALVIYGIISFLSGDHGRTREIAGELLRLGEKYGAPHQTAQAYRRLAHQHLLEGDLDAARRQLTLSRAAFLRANNTFFAHVTDLDLLWLRVRAGEDPAGLVPATQPLLDRLRASPGGQGVDDYALSVAGIIAMEAGQLELARQQFRQGAANCRRKGARHVLAGIQLLLARVHLLEGDGTGADAYLRKALAAAQAGKWEFFWDWHAETVYVLCRRALLQKIHPAWAAHLLRRWFPQRVYREAGPLLVYPDESVRRDIALLVRDLTPDSGSPVIHANCLGAFRVFVAGIEVPSSRWKTRKAENLFKFLVSDRRRRSKEEAVTTLWPEADPRQRDASLRTALTHVRQALGLGDFSAGTVVLQGSLVYLNPKMEIYTDFELFAAAAAAALAEKDAANPITADLLEQAAGLYGGDFLPDNPYDDWAADRRDELRHLYLRVLLRLIESCRGRGRVQAALDACRRYLVLEPADEQVCRTVMGLYWQEGYRQRALAFYRELAAALEREYGAAPEPATTRLYEKIRGG